MKKYLLGIDLGTTNSKGILFDEDGNVVKNHSETYKTHFINNIWAEQNSDDWWNGIRNILFTICSDLPANIAENIAGLCISSQTPTILPVDSNGIPLRNAIIWMDKRAEKEFNELLNKIDRNEYKAIVGGEPDASFLPCKLMWLKKYEPEIFKNAHKFLQASSYVNYKLTGVYSADIDQAILSQCYDVNSQKWSKRLGDIIDVDFEKIFPKPVASNTIIGYVTEEAAKQTGLLPGIPVMAGTTDGIASMCAIGISKPGQAAEIAGTSSLIFAGHTRQSAYDRPVISKVSSINGLPYVFDAPISCTGASIKWFLDTLGKNYLEQANFTGKNVFDIINELAAKVEAGSNGVLYFPYLLGERAPLWNTHAKGMFIGMSMSTTQEDLLRSVLEGTTFAVKHVLEEMKAAGAEVNSFKIAGGGAKSKTWLEIKASILNMDIQILDSNLDVPFGDVLIAGNAVGIYPDINETMEKMIKIKEVIHPKEEWIKKYEKIYPFYVSMYKALNSNLKDYESVINSIC